MEKVNPQVDFRESIFEGSSLQHEMKSNPEFVNKVYSWTKAAHDEKPESKFWKDAWEYIQKRKKPIALAHPQPLKGSLPAVK